MSMAEPRRKQKWGSDPRGTKWSNDTDKFGYKMLEKMGWSNGAGLGKNMTGHTEHVKVAVKNNTLGIGASSKDMDYNWLQTQDTFNSLLQDLNQACGSADGAIPTGPPPDSVLASSKKNRKRGARLAMFESRFKKGKDLSNASQTDLACILGTQDTRPDRLKAKAKSNSLPKSSGASNEELEDTSGLKVVVRKESMSDYFARMKAQKLSGQNGGGGEGESQNGEAAVENEETNSKVAKKSKKKNKKSKKSKPDKADEAVGEEANENSKDKKKKRKRQEESESETQKSAGTKLKKSKKSKKSRKE